MESLNNPERWIKGRQQVNSRYTTGPNFNDLPGIIAYLQQQFPDTCPALSLSDREIWYRAGQAAVWKHLQSVLEGLEERAMLESNLTIK